MKFRKRNKENKRYNSVAILSSGRDIYIEFIQKTAKIPGSLIYFVFNE